MVLVSPWRPNVLPCARAHAAASIQRAASDRGSENLGADVAMSCLGERSLIEAFASRGFRGFLPSKKVLFSAHPPSESREETSYADLSYQCDDSTRQRRREGLSDALRVELQERAGLTLQCEAGSRKRPFADAKPRP